MTRIVLAALSIVLLAAPASAQDAGGGPPLFLTPRDLGDDHVSLVLARPDGSEARPCTRVGTGQTCMAHDWLAGGGRYTAHFVVGAGRRRSYVVTMHGDELEVDISVSRGGIDVEIDRAAPPGVELRRGRDWHREPSAGDAWAP